MSLSILTRLRHRRYPCWFLPVLAVTGLLTVIDLAYPAGAWLRTVLRNYTEARHRRNRIAPPEAVWYYLSPKSGRFLVEYVHRDTRRIVVTSASNRVLWSTPISGKNSIFTRDGKYVLCGGEVRDAETGRLVAKNPNAWK